LDCGGVLFKVDDPRDPPIPPKCSVAEARGWSRKAPRAGARRGLGATLGGTPGRPCNVPLHVAWTAAGTDQHRVALAVSMTMVEVQHVDGMGGATGAAGRSGWCWAATCRTGSEIKGF
jgi:hypothetical protein